VHPAAGDGAPVPVDRSLDAAVAAVLPRLEGAFSLVFMDEHRVIGVRDPNGFRPLCLGRLEGGWVLASESPALDVVGAHFVREVEPGEMVIIDESDGVRSRRPFPERGSNPKLCIFEFVYFARPDTRLYGQSVHHARVRQGELLAEQAPVEADMVMGVPESGLPAAEGYARASGIPYGQGLVKNRYIGRTFIAPTQELRAQARAHEAQPAAENLAGQAGGGGRRLRRARHHPEADREDAARGRRDRGAPAPHLAAVKWSCFYGIDTGRAERAAGRQPHGRGDPRLPQRRLAGVHHPRPADRVHRHARRRVLRRLLHRRLPGRGPGLADQGRARGRAPEAPAARCRSPVATGLFASACCPPTTPVAAPDLFTEPRRPIRHG
jgi:hypothetical protein